MPRARRWLAAFSLPLLGLVSPELAAGFEPGQVYWAPGTCISTCGLFDVTLGGDQQGASPVAAIDRSPGQIAWDADPAVAYLTQFDLDAVVAIDSSGVITPPFATNIDGPTGLIVDSEGRMLVASFYSGAVYDVSAGGDFTGAVAFATGFLGARNLVADQSRRAVFEITGGGDFSGATPFASGFLFGPFDLVQDAAGRIYASTDGGVFDITAGGDFSAATPHATGKLFAGLALDAQGRLLASDLDSGDVFDLEKKTIEDLSPLDNELWQLEESDDDDDDEDEAPDGYDFDEWDEPL